MVFWPVLAGDLVYDDELILRQNPALRDAEIGELLTSPFFVEQIGYYRPVAAVLMATAWQLGGVTGVHVLALLVHALAGAVAFGLARALLGRPWPAALAAAMFLLHPAQVESVAWASAVTGPLAGLFVLLAVRAACGARSRPLLAAGWWMVALLCKESAVAGLPLIVGVAAWGAGAGRPRWRWLLAAFAVAFAIWAALRLALLAAPLGATAPVVDGPDAWRRISAPAELFLRHLLLLVAPYPCTPFHEFRTVIAPTTALAWLAAAIATAAALALLLGRAAPRLRIALLFALAPVLPHLVDFRVAGHYPLAERYLYLATFGFGLLLAMPRWGRWHFVPWALALVFGLASFDQSFVWRDQRQLVEHGIGHAPRDPLLAVMAGNFELAATHGGSDIAPLDRARAAFERALELASGYGSAAVTRKARADATLGLAWCELYHQQYRRKFDGERLVAHFRAALACDESIAAAWVGLGVAESIAHGPAAAEPALRRALALDDRCAEAWYYLADLQLGRGQREAARVSLERALACNPDLEAARELQARAR
ncbi:MAG: tetratricopeptide repeat protein [Planctomycetes bacterium]|nr:tetratricopeptide repeat protein [Planctomycetota bacterium]